MALGVVPTCTTASWWWPCGWACGTRRPPRLPWRRTRRTRCRSIIVAPALRSAAAHPGRHAPNSPSAVVAMGCLPSMAVADPGSSSVATAWSSSSSTFHCSFRYSCSFFALCRFDLGLRGWIHPPTLEILWYLPISPSRSVSLGWIHPPGLTAGSCCRFAYSCCRCCLRIILIQV
jgi:hypothetical protein